MQENQASSLEYTLPADQGPSDENDLARQAYGDPEAFAELYRRHMQHVYHYHLARTGNVDDAQDLTSQTFLAALESITSFRGQGSFRGWLFGIASHKVADHYRRRHPVAELDNAEDVHDPDPPPEEVVSQQLELNRVAQALRTLSAEQAEALTLRIFGSLSAAEAGRIMGKSEAAVKMLLHRGLRSLRHALCHSPEVSS